MLSICVIAPLWFSVYEGFALENAPLSVESRLAQLEAKAAPASGVNSGDNAWLLVSSALAGTIQIERVRHRMANFGYNEKLKFRASTGGEPNGASAN